MLCRVESVSCIFCGVDDSFPAIHENGFTGRKCRRCGLIYISPRPSPDKIANLYGHDHAHISATAHWEAENYKRLHARHTLRILHGYAGSGELLEIGPGAGFFLEEARAAGFAPHGIELNPAQVEFIRGRGIPCVAKTVAEAFPGQSFDVIYHCDVISHLPDPIAEFRAMHRRLRKRGLLLFETGNFGDVRVDRLARVPRFQYPDHLYLFQQRQHHQAAGALRFRAAGRLSVFPERRLVAMEAGCAAAAGRWRPGRRRAGSRCPPVGA